MLPMRFRFLLAFALGAAGVSSHAADVGELRARCTDEAMFENIHPNDAVDYINACVTRLQKGSRPPARAPEPQERRPPVGFDDDLGS